MSGEAEEIDAGRLTQKCPTWGGRLRKRPLNSASTDLYGNKPRLTATEKENDVVEPEKTKAIRHQ